MNTKARIRKFTNFLTYVLERSPDEFGLVPNADGYIKIKELLKAIHEEEGWRHIRQGDIQELLYTMSTPPFEIKDSLIRAKNRDHIYLRQPCPDPPKLVYTCVRAKSHPVVHEKGITPTKHRKVLLSSDATMAMRIGRRSDSSPVLLTVQTAKAVQSGVAFEQAGETLYLADAIPPDCFTGPPLPQTETERKSDKVPKKKGPESTRPTMPDYQMWATEAEDKKQKRQNYEKRKKQKALDREKRRLRKLKRNSGYFDEM